jgi:hypothetical protein
MGKRPLPGLASWLLGGDYPCPCGEGHGLARTLTLEALHLRSQRFHLGRQLGNLPLLLGDHLQQGGAT